ncbi:MAG: RluA family pseudouridine synthase [Eubacteriaceae bacterium]
MGNEKLEIEILEEATMRLDVFCTTLSQEYSREFIKNLIKKKKIFVNKEEKKGSYRLKEGDVVYMEIPIPELAPLQPEDIPLDIIYEDEDVLIVNKPQGLVVHPAPGNRCGTLVNGLMHYTSSLSNINGILRPGIIHRIDKDTSGLLMVAKNNLAHQKLSDQLKDHCIVRKYIGLVKGNVNTEKGTINMPIGRHPRDRIKMAVTSEHSKEAVTHFKVLERFQNYTLIEFQLETGRTHQIRVHTEKIGHPLAGDPIYGKGDRNNPFKTTGQCLHAKTLGFKHPRSEEQVLFEVEVPENFQKILETLRSKATQ